MNREKYFIFFMILLILLSLLFSLIIGLWFDQKYLILLTMLMMSGFFLIFILLYIRVQHNIDKKFMRLSDSLQKCNEEVINRIGEKKKSYKDIYEVLDKIIDYLESTRVKSIRKE